MFGKLFEIQTNATRRVRLKGTDKTLTVEAVVKKIIAHGDEQNFMHQRIAVLEQTVENFILCFALDAAKLNKIAGADLWEDV